MYPVCTACRLSQAAADVARAGMNELRNRAWCASINAYLALIATQQSRNR